MIVRDRTMRASEYKGRLTDARDELCPCRPCYNAHDCGYFNTIGNWVVRMECARRFNRGCPSTDEPQWRAQHIFTSVRGRVCQRCGARRG